MRNVPTLGIFVVILLHLVPKTDADGVRSASEQLTELDCGQTLFTNASGLIALPRNPVDNTRTSVNCTYVISAIRTSKISLNVSNIERQTIEETFRNCLNESITISCISGNASSSYCLGNNNSVIPSTPIFASCRIVEISVRSQNYNIQELVEISYAVIEENECGSTSFTGPNGVITSPRFPLNYPHNLSCVYSVEVGRMNTISLVFTTFQLESGVSSLKSCIHDWLTISCLSEVPSPANLPSGSKYCGWKTDGFKFTFSDCAFLVLNFVSDATVNHRGFRLQYAIPQPELDCGETLFTNSSGVIRLPSNPTELLAKVNCSYTISTSRLARISLLTSTVQMAPLLQSFDDCNKERIMLTCSLNVSGERKIQHPIQVRCASSPNFNPMLFTCHTLTLAILSTKYDYRGQFDLPYTAVAVDEECGNTSFAGPIGMITSPRFPLSYPHSLNCVYTLEVGRMRTVEFHFITFFLEGIPGVCAQDWLTISCLLDGSSASTSSSSSQKLCGQKTTIETLKFSNCSEVRLNFVTDSSGPRQGFRIQYIIKPTENSASNLTEKSIPDLECGDTTFNSSGVITLPTNPTSYLARVNCNYTISTDRLSKVSLNVSLIEMRMLMNSFRDCSIENFKVGCVSERTADISPGTGSVFCREAFFLAYTIFLRPMVFSNCRHLKLTVRSLNYDYQRMFRIPFTVLANDEECGNASFAGPSGMITSPRFPLTYPHSLNCIYSIDVGRRKTISLDFLSFDLQGSLLYYGYITNTCVNDWLTISCSSEVSTGSDPYPGTKYCGLKTRRPFQLSFSNCSAIRLNFVTDSSVARGGFRLQYIIKETGEECGNTSFTGPTGVITSPKYPLPYPHGLNCTYSIEVDRTKMISFDFLSFELEGSIYSSMTEICNHDWLTISCSSGANPSPSRKYCGLKTNPLQLSLSNCSEIRLNFVTDSSVARGGFRIRYIIKETGYSNGECGNTSFTGTTGVITSPKFPQAYPHGLNCVYSIDVGLVETFSLLFLSFHLEGTSNTYSADSCPHDWLTVSCSPQGSTGVGASSNRKYCGHKTTPFKFPFTFSNCSVMRLNFVTDSTVSYGGFRIQYNIKKTDEECGNTSFTGPTGVITSPKFPLTYPHGLNCVYSINVGLMETISLIFLTFQLEGTSNTYSPDNCNHDWLTISCSSGGSAAANSSSSRKYCGLKTTPLKFSFSNCSAVKLNFVTDSSVSSGGFRIKYQISPPPDSVCGASIHNRPSGVMSPPLNYTDYWDGFDCNYFINSTEQSSISLTIWSISLQRSNGGNCQSEWLLITCIDGLNELDHKVTHKSCHFLNSSTVLTFPRCAAVQVVVHKDPEVTGKSFRIEYLVNGYGTAEPELPTTSALTTRDTLETRSICVTGCAISADGTYCECMTTPSSTTQFATKPVTKSITVRTTPGTGQSDTTVVSSEIPNTVPTTPGTVQSVTTVVSSDVPKTVPTKTGTIQFEATTASSNVAITVRTTPGTVQSDTTITSSDMSVSQTAKCDIRCSEMSADDRSSCSCTSTKPDELVVKTQMSSIAGLGYSVLIPIAVIVIVILSIFVVTLWIRGRLRSRDGQEILLQEMEEDVSHLGAENGNATTIENKMYDSKGVHD